MNTFTKQRIAFWTLVAIGATVIYAAFVAFAHIAHAEPAIAGAWHSADPGTAVTGLGFEAKLAAWSLAAYTLARIVLEVLKFTAPRTPAKWDDDVRDTLARILAGAPPEPLPAKPSQSDASGTIGLLAVLLLGAGLTLQTGCAGAKHAAPAVKTAAIECGKEYAPALVRAVAKWGAAALSAGKVDWSAVEADAIALGKEIGSCAVKEFIAALKAQPTAEARSLLAAAPSDVVQGEAVLARVSGGSEVRLSD